MEGEKQKKTKGKPGSKHDKGETVEEVYSNEESYENNGDANEEAASPFMPFTTKFRHRSDLKSEISEFRHSLRDNMRKELNEFRGEINSKLQEATSELPVTTARVMEAEPLKNGIRWRLSPRPWRARRRSPQSLPKAHLRDHW